MMDSTSRGNSEDAPPYDEATIAEFLKTKRKPRSTKSCFPCRHRKVRCDGVVPCSNCVRRDHASLCRTVGESGANKPPPRAVGVPNQSERVETPTSSQGEGIERPRYTLSLSLFSYPTRWRAEGEPYHRYSDLQYKDRKSLEKQLDLITTTDFRWPNPH